VERAREPQAALRARNAAVALAVGGLAAADGGFFPQSWGWASLWLAWAAAGALLLRRRVELGRPALVMLGLFAAFAGWTLLSVLWSESVPLTALEAERALLYVIALGAFLLLGASPGAVVAAASAVGIWNLAAGGAEPVGYANGVALLAVLGLVLAMHRPRFLVSALVLVPVLVLSGSRGAWLALVVGLGTARFGRPVAVAGLAAALALGMTVGEPRPDYWRVSFEQARGAPLLGTGAGTFERHWLLNRDEALLAKDAHNLYLETLAELGPLGLALLGAALAVPFVVRSRAPAATGAYAAFVVHAALDWDWEQAALVLAALAAAAAALDGRRVRIPRAAALAVTAVAGAAAALALVGNAAVARSADAAAESEWPASARWARLAGDAAPWAAEPWARLAEAQRARGDVDDARRSLREALDRDPRDPHLWVALARVTQGAERRAALERAARLNPLGVPR
jgi:tetratricopeptide (TPR) repeat protein